MATLGERLSAGEIRREGFIRSLFIRLICEFDIIRLKTITQHHTHSLYKHSYPLWNTTLV